MWDTSTPFGERIERRLAEEEVIWLVTSDKDGVPQPSPVWFLREGDTLLIYSKPNAPKLRNIARQPRVALHFHTDAHGEDVKIFHGTAAVDPDVPRAHENPAYLEKYAEPIARLGWAPEQMGNEFSTAIRVRLEKVRGW